MRYFTAELIDSLGSPDPLVARQADAEWDRRQDAYERHLEKLEAGMPPHLRDFSRLLLHDARVCNVARQGERLIVVLHKEIPPRQLVIVTYELAGEPRIDLGARPDADRSQVMAFDYDELEGEVRGGTMLYRQSVLFSNGCEMEIPFTDAHFVLAEPLFTAPPVGLTCSA